MKQAGPLHQRRIICIYLWQFGLKLAKRCFSYRTSRNLKIPRFAIIYTNKLTSQVYRNSRDLCLGLNLIHCGQLERTPAIIIIPRIIHNISTKQGSSIGCLSLMVAVIKYNPSSPMGGLQQPPNSFRPVLKNAQQKG